MKKKRILMLSGIASLALMLIALPCAKQALAQPLPKRISYSTHKVGTTHHGVATALSKVASEHSKMMVVVSPGTGPAAWVPLMNKTGKPEFGSAHILDAWWAWTGKISPKPLKGNPLGTRPFYKGGNPNLRILMAGPRMSTGFMVRADSDIKTMQDLKGKRVGLGYLALPAAYASLLADVYNAGLSVDDFVEVLVTGPVGGVKALMAGRLDATNAAIGMGIGAEAHAKIGIRFLPGSLDPEDVKRAQEVFPGGTYVVRPAGPPGMDKPKPMWTYPILTVTSVHLPDAIAYEMLRVLEENYKEAQPLHPAIKGWEPKLMVMKNITVPYHDGAIKFYKEKGLWSAEMDTVQARLLKGEYPFLD